MTKPIDADTRFYIDIDVKNMTVIGWDYSKRQELEQNLPNLNHRRIFITEGQYNKLTQEK